VKSEEQGTLGQLNNMSIACQDKSSFDMAINCIADGDSVCMARLIADGKCKLIKKGEVVYIEDCNFFGGFMKIREKGSIGT